MIISVPHFFLMLCRWLRKKPTNPTAVLQSDLKISEAILLLWRINTLLEFVEFLNAVLHQMYPHNNYIHCFHAPNAGGEVQDFHTDKRLKSISLLSQVHVNNVHEHMSLAPSDDLVQSDYVARNENVTVIRIDSTESDEGQGLMFIICGGQRRGNAAEVDTLVKHASACYTRLLDKFRRTSIASERTLLDLPIDVDSCPDANSIQMAINTYLSEKTSSQLCCILLVMGDIRQMVCHIVGDKLLDFEVLHPMDGGLFSSVCNTVQPSYFQEPTQDEKIQLRSLFGNDIQRALAVPIMDRITRTTIGVVCLCNKLDKQKFSACDVATVNTLMSKTWTILSSSLTLQKEMKARKECEAMLQIARNLFTHLDDVGKLLKEIIQEARNLTNAERCSVFLVDKDSDELVAKVFDGIVSVDESLDPRQYDFENMNEVRIPLSQGIAGHVATTGKALNIVDAYSHPLFYRGIDDTTGFHTRNILCFPIKDHTGVVVGVSQLCNKIKGPCFTTYDMEIAEKFGVFSGISISHSLLYKEVEEFGSRNQLANDLVTYHMKVDEEDVDFNLPTAQLSKEGFGEDFDKFAYPPRTLSVDLKVKACIWMYEDLGLINKFHIHVRTLTHFILMVRKGYREDPPYHNWDHAFSVVHHGYLIVKNLHLQKKISDQEIISLLTACICHDLDHRGTNNAFQVTSQSILASLYSSEGSVMERHHFAQAVCIISTPGCNIFENMKRKDYQCTLDLMKHLILATDVATHLHVLPQLEELVSKGVNFQNRAERKMVLSLCMTAADLSDQTKNWKTTKTTSKLIYKEFFSQGDMEKRMGTRPAIINDRERACVPQLQINFMQHIALPAYRLLSTLFADYQEVFDRVTKNLARWRIVEKEFKSRGIPNTHSLDFLTEEFERDLFTDL